MNRCKSGDITEAFSVDSWKAAVILKVLGGDHYLVRLIGSCEEFRAPNFNIRARRSWQDGKRVLNGKDAVACSPDNVGENNLGTSFNDDIIGHRNMDRGDPNSGISFSLERGSGAVDCDSDACSVGSCSVISNCANSKFSCHVLACPGQDSDTPYNDAESFCGCEVHEEKHFIPPKEDLRARIRNLELHAYRRTLEALFASGPLSWEQEAMLTNLRIMLNISNDQHLIELRNLISSPRVEPSI